MGFMKILLFGLFALALVTGTAVMIEDPMSAGMTALVTVQTSPTPPDWRTP